jgi:hypothetical protein
MEQTVTSTSTQTTKNSASASLTTGLMPIKPFVTSAELSSPSVLHAHPTPHAPPSALSVLRATTQTEPSVFHVKTDIPTVSSAPKMV